MDRLTDKRFVGDGFYQPKSHEERLEIFTKVPHLKDIYNRLAEYEDTGLTPEQIKNMIIHCENTGWIDDDTLPNEDMRPDNEGYKWIKTIRI